MKRKIQMDRLGNAPKRKPRGTPQRVYQTPILRNGSLKSRGPHGQNGIHQPTLKSPGQIGYGPHGRKLGKELVVTIGNLVRAGNTFRDAAEAVGISRQVLLLWRRRGEAAIKRANEGNPIDGMDELCAFLVEQISKAEAESIAVAVKCIRKAMKQDWRAAAWWLDRRAEGYRNRADVRLEMAESQDELDKRTADQTRAFFIAVLTSMEAALARKKANEELASKAMPKREEREVPVAGKAKAVASQKGAGLAVTDAPENDEDAN